MTATNRLGIPRGLRSSDFRLIAREGFGDGLNSYTHSMAWFKGRLYVTTMRGNFALMRSRLSLGLDVWPIDCPLDPFDLDLRAEIWAYDPRADEWERVFKSPWITGSDGRRIPRDISYRAIAVHRSSESDPEKLYISTWCPARGPGPVIMSTEDGRNFTVTCEPGLCGLPVTTIRWMVSFKGRLYTTPAGSRGGNTNVSGHSVVYESRDPDRGEWHPVCDYGFGDVTNVSLHECAAWGDHLYVSTLNHSGFQLWRSTCEGEPPYRWERVLTNGAWRGALNQGGLSLYPFNGALYIGTGIQGGGIDNQNKIGPGASEMIRLHEDLSWDLIVGDPRDTPDGRKEPKSGRYAGFDNFFNGYFWRMCEHDGWLYMGTFEWSSVLGYVNRSKWPRAISNVIARVGPQNILEYGSGFDLYRSRDGDNWVPVTTNGMGNPYNMGMRTIASTPHGLFIGTANPWGPRIMPLDGRNRYVHNPRGGCEVFFAKNLP
ncbi:MAG TPA: hypothetical protein VJ722_03545 [Rhodanobacteraceae bacterium]|nr:hypothetical protein [Rhodanobacteraceae bacterium]